MLKYANIADAKREVVRWRGDPSSVEHLGDSASSVFSFKNSLNQQQIIRFTDPAFRSLAEIEGELNFVNHLFGEGVSVAQCLSSDDAELSFKANCTSGELICSSIAFAEGIEVLENSSSWNSLFFKEWGRNLAKIHRSSKNFKPMDGLPKRWVWENELFINRSKQLIPPNDKKSLEELDELMLKCQNLPRSSTEFGLIHADHAPQNFRYNPKRNLLTVFDFGNCCYHWFLSDLAISLSTIRRKQNRNQIRENILEGYSEIGSLPPKYDELIDLFIRLRIVYVYLSRLFLWSSNRTSEQEGQLAIFQSLVHKRSGWPN